MLLRNDLLNGLAALDRWRAPSKSPLLTPPRRLVSSASTASISLFHQPFTERSIPFAKIQPLAHPIGGGESCLEEALLSSSGRRSRGNPHWAGLITTDTSFRDSNQVRRTQIKHATTQRYTVYGAVCAGFTWPSKITQEGRSPQSYPGKAAGRREDSPG